MSTVPELDPPQVAELGARLRDNIAQAVKAPGGVIRDVLVALFAEGHVLIEDYPGVGKTALARALSRSVDAEYARIQCTADLLPADVVGTNVYNQRENRFEFRPGPVFANVVLVDEVNRASPKTQSGLLECMQERHVTVDIHTHELARPFIVVATQNPVEYEGTYPLPEAQLDRFMVRVSLGYPSADQESQMLLDHAESDRVLDLEPVADVAGVLGQHRRLGVRRRVAERDADSEAVELRLGQRVGALVLDGVLRGEHDEGPGELVGVLVHAHVQLLHALEQPGLGLRRGPVDLVDEDDVREDGARPELEARLALVVDIRAHHVGRQEVGGALDARVLGLDRAGKCTSQGRLADAGVVLDQDVALGEQRHEHVADHVIRGLHGAGDVVAQAGAELRYLGWIDLRDGRHAPPW